MKKKLDKMQKIVYTFNRKKKLKKENYNGEEKIFKSDYNF